MELDITLTNQSNMLNLIAVWLEDYQTMLQDFINEISSTEVKLEKIMEDYCSMGPLASTEKEKNSSSPTDSFSTQ